MVELEVKESLAHMHNLVTQLIEHASKVEFLSSQSGKKVTKEGKHTLYMNIFNDYCKF